MGSFRLACVILFLGLAPGMWGGEVTDPLRRWDLAYRSAGAGSPDYATGLGELQRGILLGVGDCDLYYRMGYCYEKRDRPEEAAAFYRRVGSRYGNTPAAAQAAGRLSRLRRLGEP